MVKVLVLTDNVFIFRKFLQIIDDNERKDIDFTFCCSSSSSSIFSKYKNVSILDIKEEYESVINDYNLVRW
jgi:hypothetical protein